MSLVKSAKLEGSAGVSSSLLNLKFRAFYNALARGPKLGYFIILSVVMLVVYAELEGTRRAMTFLCDFGKIFSESCSLVGRSVAQRALETGLIVLASGVTFSAITTAITTLYSSDDLNFLLAQPIPTSRVFALKLGETYLSAAGVPSLLTIPPLVAIGGFFHAPFWFFPLAVLSALLAYALPVGFGAGIAILLMRFAPAGRVREVATGLGVILSASLVYVIRAAKPEELLKRLANLDNDSAITQFLTQFGTPSNPLLPSSWASRVIWDGARGSFSSSIYPLLMLSALLLVVAGWLASKAYQEGWVRGLESSRVRLDPTPRVASGVENFFGKFGASGHLIVKDARLLFRDATQWSQLLILVALGGVYVVSVRAFPIQGELMKNAVGFMTLAFQGFVISGVGIRMAFPTVSFEGPGFWILRTGPISSRNIVMAKYWGALPPTLLLALVLGYFSASSLNLSAVLQLSSVMVALSSALAITALGVGVGAALPRFKADNPAEVAVSAGGLLYMVLSLFYSGFLVLIVARPAYLSVTQPNLYPGLSYFASFEGFLVLGLMLVFTVVGTIAPLWYGWVKLDQFE
jgi:ABC-2 type transport system permease protein